MTVPPDCVSSSAIWEPPPETHRDRTRLWQTMTIVGALLSAALAFLLLRPDPSNSFSDSTAADLACAVVEDVGEAGAGPPDPGQDGAMLTLHRLNAVESLARAAALENEASAFLGEVLDAPSLRAMRGDLDAPAFAEALREAQRACAEVTA